MFVYLAGQTDLVRTELKWNQYVVPNIPLHSTLMNIYTQTKKNLIFCTETPFLVWGYWVICHSWSGLVSLSVSVIPHLGCHLPPTPISYCCCFLSTLHFLLRGLSCVLAQLLNSVTEWQCRSRQKLQTNNIRKILNHNDRAKHVVALCTLQVDFYDWKTKILVKHSFSFGCFLLFPQLSDRE